MSEPYAPLAIPTSYTARPSQKLQAAALGRLPIVDFAALLERFVIDASITFIGFSDRRLAGRPESIGSPRVLAKRVGCLRRVTPQWMAERASAVTRQPERVDAFVLQHSSIKPRLLATGLSTVLLVKFPVELLAVGSGACGWKWCVEELWVH